MARFVSFALLLVVVIAAIGWYRGWFYAESQSSNSTTNMTVTVDKDKIKIDEQNAGQEARNLAEQVKDKVVSPTTVPAPQPAQ